MIKNISTIRGLQLFQLLRFAGFFITGIFLAKGPVSISTIGTYETLIFFSGAVSFFWVSGILNGLLARYQQVKEQEKGQYMFNISLLLIVFNSLLVLALYLAKNLLSFYFDSNAYSYFPLLLIYILLNNPSYFIEYILLLNERSLSLIIYGIAVFLISVLIVVVPLWLGFDLSYCLKGLIAFSVLKLIFLFLLLKEYAEFKINFKQWKEHFLFATPLILSLLLSGSAEYIDGFLVSSNFGAGTFAIFRYGAKELPFALIMANALSSALVPKIAIDGQIKNQLILLKDESKKLMHLLFPLSILLLLLSKWLYPLMFRIEFIESARIFNIYLLLIISRMVFPQTIVMSLQKTAVIFKIAVIEVLVNVIASYLLMLKFGLLGVAWGTFIAYSIEKILLTVYLQRNHQIFAKEYIALKPWAIYSLILLICYFFIENPG